jgi:hypothetical protein
MFDSVKYNLTNPAFTEDIGEANMDRMLPMAPSTVYGGGMYFPSSMGNMSIVTPLESDKVEIQSKKTKSKKTIETILTIAGVGALCVLGLKYGKKVGSAIWNKLKALGSTIKTKFKK